MTIATDLMTALLPVLGQAEDRIHTAMPPIHLGGGADVLEFRRAPVGGCVYVSAGASPELVLCTRDPAPWAASFVSRLAAAARGRFAAGHTIPLGDPTAPFAALLFTDLRGLYPVTANERWTRFLLAVGITADELATCRSHGTPAVVAALTAAKVFPASVPGRATVALDLGASPRDCPGLSPGAARGLTAVIDGLAEAVEGARMTFTPADVPLLAGVYPRLGSFEQRAHLVHLLCDSKDASLRALRLRFVREAAGADVEEQCSEHTSLASALAALEGNDDDYDTYWNDLSAAQAAARRLAL